MTFEGRNKVGIITEYKKPLLLSSKEFAHAEIAYFPDMFEKILKDSGLPDLTVELNAIKSHGLLNCEPDGHFSRKRKINGVTARVYVLRLPKQFYEPVHQQCDCNMEAIDDERKPA